METPQYPNSPMPIQGTSIPVSFLKKGETGTVRAVSGKSDVKKFLEGLGFVPGTKIRIVNNDKSGHILEVKGSRIALDNSMAMRIMVYQ